MYTRIRGSRWKNGQNFLGFEDDPVICHLFWWQECYRLCFYKNFLQTWFHLAESVIENISSYLTLDISVNQFTDNDFVVQHIHHACQERIRGQNPPCTFFVHSSISLRTEFRQKPQLRVCYQQHSISQSKYNSFQVRFGLKRADVCDENKDISW